MIKSFKGKLSSANATFVKQEKHLRKSEWQTKMIDFLLSALQTPGSFWGCENLWDNGEIFAVNFVHYHALFV